MLIVRTEIIWMGETTLTESGLVPSSDSASIVGTLSNSWNITAADTWALAASGAKALACPNAMAPNTMAENTL